MRKDKKIGIFGGSFDPVHEGHLYFAKLAKDALDLDEVWFLPCLVSPHKVSAPPSPATERVKWLKLATRDLLWAKIETKDLELGSPSYSYRTLEMLDSEHPENEWFWMIGGDQWAALDRWEKPEVLAKLASFIVLARDGADILERPGYRLHLISGEHPASATAIRAALARGDKEVPYLDPEVMRLMLG